MRILTGKIISDKMAKTVVVEVGRFVIHPMYHKRVKRSRNFHAHNELGMKIGDVVKIVEVKPISRTKTWKVI